MRLTLGLTVLLAAGLTIGGLLSGPPETRPGLAATETPTSATATSTAGPPTTPTVAAPAATATPTPTRRPRARRTAGPRRTPAGEPAPVVTPRRVAFGIAAIGLAVFTGLAGYQLGRRSAGAATPPEVGARAAGLAYGGSPEEPPPGGTSGNPDRSGEPQPPSPPPG